MIYYNVMLKSFLKRLGLFGLMMFSFGAFAQEAELGMEYMKADRKSTRLNSSHLRASRMPSSA